jgi:hypothetical protein
MAKLVVIYHTILLRCLIRNCTSSEGHHLFVDRISLVDLHTSTIWTFCSLVLVYLLVWMSLDEENYSINLFSAEIQPTKENTFLRNVC